MPPPAGGSRTSQGYIALPLAFFRFLLDLPRRFIRATATGVMLPTHSSPLQYSAAFPTLLLLLLSLSGTPPASSFPASCVIGETYWDSIRQGCVPCTRCEATEAFVVVPCQLYKDTRCGNVSSLGIDWSWMRHPHPKQQKRLRAQYQTSWSTQSVQKTTSPTQRSGMYRKVQRPRTPVGRELVPESAARVMEAREPTLVPGERVVLPSVREEEATWTWQYWLGAGSALAVLFLAVLFLALLVLRRPHYWKRCGSSIQKKSRKTERRKGQFSNCENGDHSTTKGEFIVRLYSDKRSLVMEEILLDKEKAAAAGSLRDESENLYVKELAPASSTMVTMMPGRLPSVKVEVQGGDSIHRSLAKNCLRLGCASRTELTGRSSAV